LVQSVVGDLPDVDEVVGEAGEEFGAVVVPGEGQGGGALASLGGLLLLSQGQVGVGLVVVGHQVPDGHAVVGGHAHPLQLLVEQDLVDLALRVDGSDGLFQIGNIPEHKILILASSGQILGVRTDSHGVDLTVMRLESVSDLKIGIPDLESPVPPDRGEIGVEVALGLTLQLGGVSDLTDPILVVVQLGSVSAVSQSVPKFDLLVGSGGNDLSVVLRETDGVDLLLVADELSHGLAGFEVPKTESLVPGGTDGETSVGGKSQVRDKVVVAGQLSLRLAHDALFGGLVQGPGQEGLVTGSGNQEGFVGTVFALGGGGLEAGHPAVVALEVAEVLKVLVFFDFFHG